MIALIKKDWRMNRATVIGSAAIAAMPYLIFLTVYLFQDTRQRSGELTRIITGAAICSLWLTAASAVVFGGAAFAHERSDRSADFLAMLPVSRSAIVTSKMIVTIGWLAIPWLVNAIAIWLAGCFDTPPASHAWSGGLGESISLTIGATLMFFGVAWLFSTFLASASRAAVISLVATVATMATVVMAVTRIVTPRSEDYTIWLVSLLVTSALGTASFIGGSIYYVRRIEP